MARRAVKVPEQTAAGVEDEIRGSGGGRFGFGLAGSPSKVDTANRG
jgi:hypothetical protein